MRAKALRLYKTTKTQKTQYVGNKIVRIQYRYHNVCTSAMPPSKPITKHQVETRSKGALLLRLLPEERRALKENAREAGLSMASFLRACALGAPGPRAQRAPTIEAEVLGRAVAALNSAGSNLKRVAEHLNDKDINVQECLAEVQAAAALIRQIVGRHDRESKHT